MSKLGMITTLIATQLEEAIKKDGGTGLGVHVKSWIKSMAQEYLDESVKLGELRPISTAPRDGTYILLFGESGYSTTPLRAEVGHYDGVYRPNNPWQTHSNDGFTDGGSEPLYWAPIPEVIPEAVEEKKKSFYDF